MPSMIPHGGDLGYRIGDIFENRKYLSDAGLHRPHQAGIWNAGGDFAVSIVVSGGYVDDSDNGIDILYTGQGGRDQSGKQISDQKLTRGNLGLYNSMISKVPVRVIRGYQTKEGPEKGYRYDGLHLVQKALIEPSRDGPFIWRFVLTPVITSTDELLWQKELTKTDSQRQNGKKTGDLRLTRANFFVEGSLIDQTTYFRHHVFGDQDWEKVGGKEKETCTIRAKVTVLGKFNGRTKFIISHRPNGESGQGNYTTGLRWGAWMGHILTNEIDCTGRTLQLIRKDEKFEIKII